MKRVGRSFTKSKGISYNKKEKTIAFQESISDTQQLSVKLQIYYPEKKNDLCYEVIKWKKKLLGHGRRMISFRFIEISKRGQHEY